MSNENTAELERRSVEDMESTVTSIKKMLMIGAVFAVIGYLLAGSALFFELTEFHTLLEDFFRTHTEHSLAGGGPDRTSGALNEDLAVLHSWPSTLLWLKLGGVAHILLGIFIALAAIVRALALMPHRLSYEMERTQG
jgi:small-conductance mechanosensitive channel